MKKLLSVALLTAGFAGAMIAGATALPFHIGNVNTSSFTGAQTSEKNPTVSIIRLPEPGNPNRPSLTSDGNQTLSIIRLPEPGNPNRPS